MRPKKPVFYPLNRMLILLTVGLFSLVALLSAPALAHPHLWIDARAKVAFDDQGRISAIEHAWTFDEAFSIYIIQGLDEDRNGVFTREELAPLAQTNVEALAEFAFFTFMGVEEDTIDFAGPQNYWLSYDKAATRLTLHFTLPLKQPALVIGKMVLEIYDPEYFIAFSLNDQNAVQLAQNAPSTCALEIQKAPVMDEAFAAVLGEIPSDQRQVPDDMFQITSQLSNSAIIHCS
ncbi:MAG: ABC transporter substrate-binding protein [Hyphomicrobiales bacterium]|nr:MAG: ABC transporter substrate-binding protein [Hyphomicrobiales bacterium]